MAEYVDIDGRVVVTDTRGRELETTVRHILEFNKGVYTAADVVEVVRCKDCAMANADSDERYMYCTKCHEYKPIDYYCAEGRHADA